MHQIPRSYIKRLAFCVIIGFITDHALAESSLGEFTQKVDIEAKQKIKHKWKPRDSVVLVPSIKETLKPDQRTSYGGAKLSQRKQTGFFRTERDLSGQW